MDTLQRIISAVMAITIVVAAIVCHHYGIPDKMILLVAGIMGIAQISLPAATK